MQIDELREKVAEQISTNMGIWDDVLNDTTPGNYGCEYWEAEVSSKDIFVDIPARTFTVKDGSFSADLVMGASKGETSFNASFSKSFSASGKFDFKSATEIVITDISIDIDKHIY